MKIKGSPLSTSIPQTLVLISLPTIFALCFGTALLISDSDFDARSIVVLDLIGFDCGLRISTYAMDADLLVRYYLAAHDTDILGRLPLD